MAVNSCPSLSEKATNVLLLLFKRPQVRFWCALYLVFHHSKGLLLLRGYFSAVK